MTGVLEIASAIRLRRVIEHEWAARRSRAHCRSRSARLMFYRPIAGGVAVVWWLGAYAFVFGILMIVFGFRLRSFARVAPGGGELPRRGCASASKGPRAAGSRRAQPGAAQNRISVRQWKPWSDDWVTDVRTTASVGLASSQAVTRSPSFSRSFDFVAENTFTMENFAGIGLSPGD